MFTIIGFVTDPVNLVCRNFSLKLDCDFAFKLLHTDVSIIFSKPYLPKGTSAFSLIAYFFPEMLIPEMEKNTLLKNQNYLK